jgi:hypothetical protein
MLAWHPKVGRLTLDGDTRRLTIAGTPYIAFYRLRERAEILAFLHVPKMAGPSEIGDDPLVHPFLLSIAAWAAARRAIGTRKGEQET